MASTLSALPPVVLGVAVIETIPDIYYPHRQVSISFHVIGSHNDPASACTFSSALKLPNFVIEEIKLTMRCISVHLIQKEKDSEFRLCYAETIWLKKHLTERSSVRGRESMEHKQSGNRKGIEESAAGTDGGAQIEKNTPSSNPEWKVQPLGRSF